MRCNGRGIERYVCAPSLQSGGTALHVAAEKGHTLVVEQLLTGKASVNAEDVVCAHASVGGVLRLRGC